MIEFRVIKESKKSKARVGIIKTPHGEIETPAFVPVATQAAIKSLNSEEVLKTNSQILISNTFHLHLKPGEKIIKSSGGIHKFMNWQGPLMTDSGGYQVFSLGFGRDMGIGKVIKFFPEDSQIKEIKKFAQPTNVKITDSGVYFRSPIDGTKLFIGPKESIKIQEDIGADIILAFDECTPPLAGRGYVEKSLARTHKWAKACLSSKKTKQAIYGIIQGSVFKDLRVGSAKYISSLGFDGYAIGGDLGKTKHDTLRILKWSFESLSGAKPRHLLGIGRINDILPIVSAGVDTFDCIVPTHYARRGIIFTHSGPINLKRKQFIKDKKPLDSKCKCVVCRDYKRNYISHLFRSNEISALSLATFHNLHFFNEYTKKLREKIKKGKI